MSDGLSEAQLVEVLLNGAGAVSSGSLGRGADLHEVRRLLRLAFQPDVARSWLMGRNAHLGGTRPIDALRLGNVEEVLAALRSELAGGFA